MLCHLFVYAYAYLKVIVTNINLLLVEVIFDLRAI